MKLFRPLVLLCFLCIARVLFSANDEIRPREILREVDSTLARITPESALQARMFIHQVIAAKKENDLSQLTNYTADRYEKMNVGWIDLTEKEKNIILFRYFKFLFENTDTSDVTNQPIQYVVSRETAEELTVRPGEPKRRLVKGINRDWVDRIVNEQGIKAISDEAFSGFSIYDNDIQLLMQNFVGPLSSTLARGFYRYTLAPRVDTVGDTPCRVVDFEPVNPRTLGFRGRLYVVDDSTYAVRRVVMRVLNEQNLNFVDNLIIMQDYSIRQGDYWLLAKDDISIEVALLKAFSRRISYYSGYRLNALSPEEFNQRPHLAYTKEAWNQPDDYWKEVRPIQGNSKEHNVKAHFAQMLDEGKSSVPGYLGMSLLNDGFDLGKFEIGPIFSMVSQNDIEGYRLRLGGTTTLKFSPKLFLEGYGAYGTRDHLWKYFAQAEYCFSPRGDYPTEFPVHSLALSIKNDVSFPGQDLVSVNKDNVFYSFRRFPIQKMYLVKNIGLRYLREYQTGLSYKFSLNVFEETPIGQLRFEQLQPDGTLRQIKSLASTELGVSLRYAPQESFVQRRYKRYHLSRNSPVLTLSHRMGLQGIFGSDYFSNLSEFSIFRRFRASAYGYADLMIKGGKQWNKVPFPSLIIPQANPSYVHVKETFDLMNVMEFISDQYISWDFEYNANGLLFNLLPLNRYLKLREVVTFSGYMGSLSDKNNPALTSGTFLFPTDEDGNPVSFDMKSRPYMEVGVGIDNLFRFFRIDYIWRLTYRDHPGVNTSGIRIGLNLKF